MAYLSAIRTLTATRIGMGQAAGLIDLPVIREKSTHWPYVPGSGVKGVLRANARAAGVHSRILDSFFGSGESAPSLVVTDLHILLLPVRSFYGVFALLTCPLSLSRTYELLELLDKKERLPTFNTEPMSIVPTKDSALVVDNTASFEDIRYSQIAIHPPDQVKELAKTIEGLTGFTIPANRLCVVDDDSFTYFAKHATETRARTELETHRKKAKDGSLRFEEYLCPNTVFVGYANGTACEDYEIPKEKTLQIGAEASIGAGMVQWRLR